MLHLLRPSVIIRSALIITVLFVVVACSEKSPTSEKGSKHNSAAAPVLIGKVQRKVAPLILDAVGVVEAIHTAALRSQVTGTIMKVGFQEGQDVEQGGLLFELDPRPFQNALNSAEADLERIRAQ